MRLKVALWQNTCPISYLHQNFFLKTGFPLFDGRMRDKKEFGFEHNATEGRFVAKRMSEFLSLILPSKRGREPLKTEKKLNTFRRQHLYIISSTANKMSFKPFFVLLDKKKTF